jgi:hypothetical protein
VEIPPFVSDRHTIYWPCWANLVHPPPSAVCFEQFETLLFLACFRRGPSEQAKVAKLSNFYLP